MPLSSITRSYEAPSDSAPLAKAPEYEEESSESSQELSNSVSEDSATDNQAPAPWGYAFPRCGDSMAPWSGANPYIGDY
jgi:hypothetical protein